MFKLSLNSCSSRVMHHLFYSYAYISKLVEEIAEKELEDSNNRPKAKDEKKDKGKKNKGKPEEVR